MIATNISIAENDMLNQVEAIFQFATEAILITDNQGKIIRVNPSTEMMFGYATDEFIGQPIEILIPSRLTERQIFQNAHMLVQWEQILICLRKEKMIQNFQLKSA